MGYPIRRPRGRRRREQFVKRVYYQRTGYWKPDGERMVFLGTAPPGDAFTGVAEPFHGLLLRHGKKLIYQVNAAREK